MLSQCLVYLLMLDSLWVAIGLAKRKNMWSWIVTYWFILTAKNFVDFVSFAA